MNVAYCFSPSCALTVTGVGILIHDFNGLLVAAFFTIVLIWMHGDVSHAHAHAHAHGTQTCS